jgi:hypothetical protein
MGNGALYTSRQRKKGGEPNSYIKEGRRVYSETKQGLKSCGGWVARSSDAGPCGTSGLSGGVE